MLLMSDAHEEAASVSSNQTSTKLTQSSSSSFCPLQNHHNGAYGSLAGVEVIWSITQHHQCSSHDLRFIFALAVLILICLQQWSSTKWFNSIWDGSNGACDSDRLGFSCGLSHDTSTAMLLLVLVFQGMLTMTFVNMSQRCSLLNWAQEHQLNSNDEWNAIE